MRLFIQAVEFLGAVVIITLAIPAIILSLPFILLGKLCGWLADYRLDKEDKDDRD